MWQNRLNKLRFGSFKKQSSEFAKPKAVVIFRFLMPTLSPAGSHYAMWTSSAGFRTLPRSVQHWPINGGGHLEVLTQAFYDVVALCLLFLYSFRSLQTVIECQITFFHSSTVESKALP